MIVYACDVVLWDGSNPLPFLKKTEEKHEIEPSRILGTGLWDMHDSYVSSENWVDAEKCDAERNSDNCFCQKTV